MEPWKAFFFCLEGGGGGGRERLLFGIESYASFGRVHGEREREREIVEEEKGEIRSKSLRYSGG